MALRKTFFLILCFVLVSCGARDKKNYPVFVKGQITKGIPSSYGDGGVISSLKRQDLILDSDHDGILDRDDFDIDNDSIPNDCDLAPFDLKTGIADLDHDGIPDFCDINIGVQSDVFLKYGIMLNLNENASGEFDLNKMMPVLSRIASETQLPNASLVTLTMTTGLPYGEYGVYDKDWMNIRLRPDRSAHDEFPQLTNTEWSLVHELYHFVGFTNAKRYSAFEEKYTVSKKYNTLIFPTEYSKISEEEFFAEENTFRYFFGTSD